VGLRERNAELTRRLIVDTAISLFIETGYETTTMENVAEAAGIGTSTLYRYFSTKDELAVAPLAIGDQMADALRERPGEEPLGESLGHALRALVLSPRPDAARLAQVRVVVEQNAGPRARLADDFARAREHLEVALVERLGREPGDLFCSMTARVATAVLEVLVDPQVPEVPVGEEAAARLDQVLALLHDQPPVLPEAPRPIHSPTKPNPPTSHPTRKSP
jgi:AcrR family transcriptional regulator